MHARFDFFGVIPLDPIIPFLEVQGNNLSIDEVRNSCQPFINHSVIKNAYATYEKSVPSCFQVNSVNTV